MKKKPHIIFWTAAAVILLLTLAILSINITKIQVTGNKKYSSQQIESILFKDRWDKNSLFFYLKNRFQPHQDIPFVEDYEIVFQRPTEIEIIIYEKSVVGYVTYMNSCMYFDKDGIIVESTNSRLAGIPRITGLEFGRIVLNCALPVENQQIFEHIMNLTQVLSIYEINVDQIYFDHLGNASLIMDELEVHLGSNKDINGKISELHDMLPKLTGLAGTLKLDNYEETKGDVWYSFIKK